MMSSALHICVSTHPLQQVYTPHIQHNMHTPKLKNIDLWVSCIHIMENYIDHRQLYKEFSLCVSVCLSVPLPLPGYPGTHYVDLAGFKLTEVCLPLLPECWDAQSARAYF